MSYLVDSDWLIDAIAGRPAATVSLAQLSAEGLAVSIIAVAEVYEGAFSAADPAASLAIFRGFLDGYSILPLTDSIAARFGRLRAALRRQGRLIPDMDLLIAATALEEDLTLVTRNFRHFERIAALKLYR
jgi:tRNA(fMet)-specific endonuclease VapC